MTDEPAPTRPAPTARDCVCPAPADGDSFGDVRVCADCPACMVRMVSEPCWAAAIAAIAARCMVEAIALDGGRIVIVDMDTTPRMMIYRTTLRTWAISAPWPASITWLPGLDGECPETLDDARWIAASHLATLPTGG